MSSRLEKGENKERSAEFIARFNLVFNLVNPEIQKLLKRLHTLYEETPILEKKQNDQFNQTLKLAKKNYLPPCFLCLDINHEVGQGIFYSSNAPAPIRKSTVLGHYAGEFIVCNETELQPDLDSRYMFEISNNFFLNKKEHRLFFPDTPYNANAEYSLRCNAKEKGNWVRFINHGSGENANCTPTIIRKRLKKEWQYFILICAAKTIKPGEQLLIDYGIESYWEQLETQPWNMTPRTFVVSGPEDQIYGSCFKT